MNRRRQRQIDSAIPRGSAATAFACALAVILMSVGAARAQGPDDMPDRGSASLEDHPIPATPSDYIHHEVGWALFVYPRDARGRVEPLVESAGELHRALRDELGQPVLGHVEIRVAPQPEAMAALAPRGLAPPPGSEGAAYPRHRLILLSLHEQQGSTPTRLEEIYRHQLAHVALFDAVGGHPIPGWFHEGYAVHTSGEDAWSRARILWDATLSEHLLPLSSLDSPHPAGSDEGRLARAQAADIVRFLLRPHERDRFRLLVASLAKGNAFHPSLELSYGAPVRSLEREWRDDLDDRHGHVPVLLAGGLLVVAAIASVAVVRRRRRRDRRDVGPRADDLSPASKESAGRAPVVRVTLTPRSAAEAVDLASLRKQKLRDVPKVEHEGKWHTLH